VTLQWILNASPFICLARAGYLHLLRDIPTNAILPQAVADEIAAGPAGDLAQSALASGIFQVIDVEISHEILAWDLGLGESAVLSYVLQNPGWEAIIDDYAARKCARSFSIPLRGTLSIVIMAKQAGLIPSSVEVLAALRNSGIWLDDSIIREVLKKTTGEEW
jgi:predicted nucleic acid-binding protein